MNNKNTSLPLITLQDIIIFPGTIVPILINSEHSINTLNSINNTNLILLTTQKQQNEKKCTIRMLFKIGTLGKVIQKIIFQNNQKIIIEALYKVKLFKIKIDNIITAQYKIVNDINTDNNNQINHLNQELIHSFQEYSQNNKKINLDMFKTLNTYTKPIYIINIIASYINTTIKNKQQLLEETNIINKIKKLTEIITSKNIHTETEKEIQHKLRKQIEKTQREFYLNEQLKIIQQEIEGGYKSELSDLENKIQNLHLSLEAKEKAINELKKLKTMSNMSAEASIIRNYLDSLLAMPWGKVTKIKINIDKAENILNQQHYGLKLIKERIIEYLAVLQRSQQVNTPILCFIGPPGVGKTSLAKSIAEATGRKYTKFSLGGVRDEAEIRGHRKTYLGSMPGRIISLIKNAKVDNPVMLLDEIDKMTCDYRGDPTSALLEVLDPEQNKHFVDHYLEIEYNLSKIMFIATANSYELPRALLDRMEIIHISGYTENEKIHIATNYLINKQKHLHGLSSQEIHFSQQSILNIIRYYTKESGVRELEREIGKISRKVLTQILKNKSKKINITPKILEKYLGIEKYTFGLVENHHQIGVTNGLAYSELGGDLLSIEAVCFKGSGKIKCTGKLGDIMKESIETAYSCILTNTTKIHLKKNYLKNLDIHVHVPEGGIPKDGPSAGIAIFTTLVSLLTNTPVKKYIAMTGEITLKGKILPIGGLKEKLLAAKRGGILHVLIPQGNIKELKEIPKNITNKLKITPVNIIDNILQHAFITNNQSQSRNRTDES